ncbi:unnamed protein product [Thlaspi arvense]|uniref:Uncharacterized protein n=1 Tax=Thlaspi arvense TaxID=13288 RepID=A0AAU9S2R6_THLAR|nr:unnamed protein product [Thlaspi arvense]
MQQSSSHIQHFMTRWAKSVGVMRLGHKFKLSISAKVSYAEQKGLLGYFAWHLANDNDWAFQNKNGRVRKELNVSQSGGYVVFCHRSTGG